MTIADASIILSIELIKLTDGKEMVFSRELREQCILLISKNIPVEQSAPLESDTDGNGMGEGEASKLTPGVE